MKKFENKVALVTGGGSGIGRAIALAFAKEGAKVIIADYAVAPSEETVHKIEEANGESLFIQSDVSQSEQVKALIDQIVKKYGQLDIACNNAGIEGNQQQASTINFTEENWGQIMNINLTGVWLCMKYEIQQMLIKRKGGVVINMSSIAGVVAFPRASAYSASKHGVIGLTKTAAVEYAPYGIRVNAICPGMIMTPMVKRNKDMDQLTQFIPMRRLGTPEEIAEAVIWLSSDSAAYITGQAIIIDGGFTAQ